MYRLGRWLVALVLCVEGVAVGASAATWTSAVSQGYHAPNNGTLSVQELGDINDDDGDIPAPGRNFADIGDLISDLKWYSVHFDNTFSATTGASAITQVRLYIDHRGPNGKAGDFTKLKK